MELGCKPERSHVSTGERPETETQWRSSGVLRLHHHLLSHTEAQEATMTVNYLWLGAALNVYRFGLLLSNSKLNYLLEMNYST